jgi:phosphomannomutase
MQVVKEKSCDIGIVVDPDVDRLALISEDGEMFGEEYTLVVAADYLLQHKSGNLVSNLSSSRALRDLAKERGVGYAAAAVGEVNVVSKMKECQAVLGGEGNGGVILPDLHYGRDSLVGIAIILSHLATAGKTLSEMRASYPAYFMGKNKIQLEPDMDVDGILKSIATKYQKEEVSTIDGVKIDFTDEWVHLRKSNTEPIIRLFGEAKTQERIDEICYKYNMLDFKLSSKVPVNPQIQFCMNSLLYLLMRNFLYTKGFKMIYGHHLNDGSFKIWDKNLRIIKNLFQ